MNGWVYRWMAINGQMGGLVGRMDGWPGEWMNKRKDPELRRQVFLVCVSTTRVGRPGIAICLFFSVATYPMTFPDFKECDHLPHTYF